MKKKMRPLVIGVAAALALSAPAQAQDMADGQVTKIDPSASKITLKHGPLKKFDMDGMTMVFRVQDPAMLKQVKVGDKVKFEADRVNGQISVVKIETGRTQAAPSQAAAAANLPIVTGTVEKVDLGAGKVTIDHGAIPNLNMDPMTMVFRIQDPASLKGVKAGDMVRFQADRVNGQLSIVSIRKGK